MAIFLKTPGNRAYSGTAAEYDQVDYPGALTDYTFTQNANGSVTVSHAQLGTDTLTSIEGFWFQGESNWYSLADALAASGGGGGNVPSNGNDTLIGSAGNDTFIGSFGNDTIDGNGGGYNQVDYAGSLADYTFTQNTNGTVSVTHATRGTDTLTDIDGLWFSGEGAWYSIAAAIAASGGGNGPTNGNDTLMGTAGNDIFIGSNGNDTIDGNGGAYNQIDYAGALADYTFTQNGNGTITAAHATRGTDTLTDVDGFWFSGEGAWYSLANVLTTTPGTSGGTMINGVYTGTNNDDILIGGEEDMTFYAGRGWDTITGTGDDNILRVDGDLVEWTITEVSDDIYEMSHAMWGVKTIENIEDIIFERSWETYSVEDVMEATEGLPTFRIDGDGVINGTPWNDVMNGNATDQMFYGGLGDDSYNGRGGFDQINYDGNRSDYTITQNPDGSFNIDHEIWGTDTVTNVEGFYFSGGNEWINADNLI